MEKDQEHAWSVSKERLIREIKSTYEAIMKFKDFSPKTDGELESLDTEDLYKELQTQTELLDQLVANWDISK